MMNCVNAEKCSELLSLRPMRPGSTCSSIKQQDRESIIIKISIMDVTGMWGTYRAMYQYNDMYCMPEHNGFFLQPTCSDQKFENTNLKKCNADYSDCPCTVAIVGTLVK